MSKTKVQKADTKSPQKGKKRITKVAETSVDVYSADVDCPKLKLNGKIVL